MEQHVYEVLIRSELPKYKQMMNIVCYQLY